MERFTKFNVRKIAYLVLLILEVGSLIGATLVKDPTNKLFLWQMIMSSDKLGLDASIGAYIIAFAICVIICSLLIGISYILQKKDNSYLSGLGFICVLLVICLITNTITKTLSTRAVVLLVVGFVINSISSLYSFVCIKYNYEVIFNVTLDKKEDSEESKDGKVQEETK